ncbi:hypothetical protein A2714_00060 [Candidatus Woesebacteria bacterium RIFCSPHIGHO2_01_FULL_38_9]|uniref:FAD-binding FR-type domain-containing protein n=2 Tax=Candidatus Woeseibacteriota TaxID=1752722 RepID=A0A1F7Y2U7_9BACT|nr:MAG: hypothetical protein A2714_00060 [Candidatus Woesebacteria bacterium RIFCSPHIGHO2_01_FULL_38_9]OGM58279.1 MAG: hypothetical protein A3A75_04555 [Candidatus Woesebacteria bacterium RIFCSPLOWO2_01_FULL_39_10]
MKLKFIKKQKEAKDTATFFFEPEKKVMWLPGQYFYFTLPELKYPDSRGPTRHFTISASPTEGSTLRLTTRIRKDSGYKNTLNEMAIGTFIEGEGPNGTYILDENEEGNHILLAGGIGITPFRSFIKYNIDKKLSETKIHLIYANSTPEEITFREELESWDKTYENIKIAFTISRPEDSKEKWTGLTGRIDGDIISRLASHLSPPTYWVCGPPAMVEATEKVLGSLKITSDRVRSEKFTGY